MSRKVFISFLGTGNYKECVYTLNDKKSNVVKFVQEALIQLLSDSFVGNHKFLFFLTKEAGSKYSNEIEEIILKYPSIQYEIIYDIPDGLSEEEIWKIFRIVFEKINDYDILHLDITHGFRSLPMLALTLVNYAKSLKNVTVGGIYYGAFEVLGPSYNIDERIPDAENRLAPILDLTSFSDLQDWTSASKVFLTSGNSNLLSNLLEQIGYNDLSVSLLNYTKTINTTRLQSIIDGDIAIRVKRDMDNIALSEAKIPMLKSILEKVSDHFSSYQKNDVQNGLIAIEWCLQHGLIHQAYALMSEYLISYVCQFIKIDIYNKLNRETVNSALSMNNYENFAYKDDSQEEQKDILQKLKNLPNIKKLRERSKSINLQNRHDILHAGMRPNPKAPEELILEAKEKFDKLKSITL